MIDSSTGEANTHMYWTGFTLITCKNSIAGPIVNTQSVVVLVWIILGVSIKPGLCDDIPESLYGRTGIPYREHRTTVYRYISISLHPYQKQMWEKTKLTIRYYTMKHIVSRMSSYFPNRWPLSYLNLTKTMKTHIRRQQHKKF